MRIEYEAEGLDVADVTVDPVDQFDRWFGEAVDAQIVQPNAFVLATADGDGDPSARTVLMKAFDRAGLVFYTNRSSRKGIDMAANPRAAACFLWLDLHRQVRMSGRVETVSDELSDDYFASRPLASQISAAASPQSHVVASRSALDDAVAEVRAAHPTGAIPRPDHWGGYRIVPDGYEFWQGRPDRLHDRVTYVATADGWRIQRLAP